jgi:hypothetical protein
MYEGHSHSTAGRRTRGGRAGRARAALRSGAAAERSWLRQSASQSPARRAAAAANPPLTGGCSSVRREPSVQSPQSPQSPQSRLRYHPQQLMARNGSSFCICQAARERGPTGARIRTIDGVKGLAPFPSCCPGIGRATVHLSRAWYVACQMSSSGYKLAASGRQVRARGSGKQ